MEAMLYEILIRQANHCGRHGVESANADIYRSFEHAWSFYSDSNEGKPVNSIRSKDELAAEAHIKMGIVIGHVRSAISKVMSDNKDDLTDEQEKKLNEALSLLRTQTKEAIDKSIRMGCDVFKSIGLLA